MPRRCPGASRTLARRCPSAFRLPARPRPRPRRPSVRPTDRRQRGPEIARRTDPRAWLELHDPTTTAAGVGGTLTIATRRPENPPRRRATHMKRPPPPARTASAGATASRAPSSEEGPGRGVLDKRLIISQFLLPILPPRFRCNRRHSPPRVTSYLVVALPLLQLSLTGRVFLVRSGSALDAGRRGFPHCGAAEAMTSAEAALRTGGRGRSCSCQWRGPGACSRPGSELQVGAPALLCSALLCGAVARAAAAVARGPV